MNAKLISITAPLLFGINNAEHLITYTARVSNPDNQFAEPDRLIKYLIEHKHWSPFELVDATVEIEVPRYIAQQILRHRSFSFQELSQRYTSYIEFHNQEFREQAAHNRQSSTNNMNEHYFWNGKTTTIKQAYQKYIEDVDAFYNNLINSGVARETARSILPLSIMSRMYMKGSIRSWIHYLELRTKEDTQKEHREIALLIRDALKPNFPITFNAVNL